MGPESAAPEQRKGKRSHSKFTFAMSTDPIVSFGFMEAQIGSSFSNTSLKWQLLLRPSLTLGGRWPTPNWRYPLPVHWHAFRTWNSPCSRVHGGSRKTFAESYRGFMYQKIARATSATVMIHRMTSLLPFFSSAINKEYTTPEILVQVPRRFPPDKASTYGFAAAAPTRL